jgi:hypothetical protein
MSQVKASTGMSHESEGAAAFRLLNSGQILESGFSRGSLEID